MTTIRTGLARGRVGLLVAGTLAVIAALLGAVATVLGAVEDAVFGAMSAYGSLTYAFVGVVVLWRRPGHGIGRLALVIGMAFAAGIYLTVISAVWHPTTGVQSILDGPQQLLFDVVSLISSVFVIGGLVLGASLLVTWFPEGHRTSRLGALVEVILVIAVLAGVVASLRDPILQQIRWSAAKEAVFTVALTISIGGLALAYFGAFLELGLRYRHEDPLRRTQMRWVWAAEGVSVVATVGLFVFGDRFESLWSIWVLTFSLPILAIAVAITRYHLYDIDRIVSSSISYLVVTAVLLSIFAGLILVMQSLLSGAVAAPGAELDPRVVAASTLAVAALFNPLRVRVQSVVDRRFHRARYDATRIVAGFSGRLRDELDLPTVSGELRATTAQALEPAMTGVWLRERQGP
jgi:hypothetical protein